MARKQKLELTISPNYVDWTVWECLREFFQNALDAEDDGHEMSVEYSPHKKRTIEGVTRHGVLEIRNCGARIHRKSLILGETDKRNDSSARGQFGEGMKLAWAALLRRGYRVLVRTGDERWVPRIEASKAFETELLTVEIGKVVSRDDVCIEIQGITPAQWQDVEQKVLSFGSMHADDYMEVLTSRVLLADRYVGKLFCRGLYVCKLQHSAFGYDLANLKLDRDRRSPELWSLEYEVRVLLLAVAEQDDFDFVRFADAVADDTCMESKAFASAFSPVDEETMLAKGVTEHFRDKHGDKALPVADLAESENVRYFGFEGVVVCTGLRKIVGDSMVNVATLDVENRTKPSRVYGAHDLDKRELAKLDRVIGLVSRRENGFSKSKLNVVDFVDDRLLGTFNSDDSMVRLARRLLEKSIGDLLVTLIHEVAHRYGSDGSLAHREAEERMMAGVFDDLISDDAGVIAV